MNLLHLKYAVVIAESKSMTKAAKKLYTAQPNLSRAMRELEGALGITIFERTPKGITPTAVGEEFLGYARKILAQVDQVEAMYQRGSKSSRPFSISVPRASYISCAFTSFIKKSNFDPGAEVFYHETNPMRVITNITESDYKLGILRYQTAYEENFRELLEEKGLTQELIYEFSYRLLLSKDHPLANKVLIRLGDLRDYIEIAHADPFVPSMPLSTVRKNEVLCDVDKHIYVFERGSQMDILSLSPDTFMWVSPTPQRLLQRYNLVQRVCYENDRKYRDVLIRKREYTLTKEDKAFIDELMNVKRELDILPNR